MPAAIKSSEVNASNEATAVEATAQMTAHKTPSAEAVNEVVAQVAANEADTVAHLRDDVQVDDEAAANEAVAKKATKEADAMEAADRDTAQEIIKVPEVEKPADWNNIAEVDSPDYKGAWLYTEIDSLGYDDQAKLKCPCTFTTSPLLFIYVSIAVHHRDNQLISG